jgi:hypothetical protein
MRVVGCSSLSGSERPMPRKHDAGLSIPHPEDGVQGAELTSL